MNIDINKLVSFEELQTNTADVLERVTEEGNLIILYKNRPAFVISEYLINSPEVKEPQIKRSKNTLQEAMRIVLEEQPDGQMHAKDLADTIYNENLYWRKDGQPVKYNQIRARAGHYPEQFAAYPGNIIKLVEEVVMVNPELVERLVEVCDKNEVFFTAGGRSDLGIAEVNQDKETVKFRRSTGKISWSCQIRDIQKINNLVSSGEMDRDYKKADEIAPTFGNYIIGLLNHIGYNW